MRRALAISLLLASCAAREPETELATEELRVCHSTTVEGIDVAEFDGTIDWNMVHASGREFGIARIADGNHIDPQFAANWSGMRAAGMIRGAYYFFRPTQDVPTQAQHVFDAVGVLGDGDLPVTMDIECMCPYMPSGSCSVGTGCATAASAAAALAQMVDLVQASTHKRPMIYSSARVWDGPTYYNSVAHQPMSALWVVGYGVSCPNTPIDWMDWQFWQYSDGTCTNCVTGPIPGVPSSPSCDRDRWNGTLDQLRAFANTEGTPGVDAGVATDAAMASDAAIVGDAAVTIDAATANDAASHDAFALALDGAHVDIVRPADGAVSVPPMHGGCGCAAARTSSVSWLALIALALISRRVFERRTRGPAEQQRPQRVDVA